MSDAPAIIVTPGPPARRPDAILTPRGYGGHGGKERIKALFQKTLGVRRFQCMNCGPNVFNLLTPEKRHDAHALKYPPGHPSYGQERYHWYFAERDEVGGAWLPVEPAEGFDDDLDRVKVGYYKVDPFATDADVRQQVRADMKTSARERHNELLRDPEFRARLGLPPLKEATPA